MVILSTFLIIDGKSVGSDDIAPEAIKYYNFDYIT